MYQIYNLVGSKWVEGDTVKAPSRRQAMKKLREDKVISRDCGTVKVRKAGYS